MQVANLFAMVQGSKRPVSRSEIEQDRTVNGSDTTILGRSSLDVDG